MMDVLMFVNGVCMYGFTVVMAQRDLLEIGCEAKCRSWEQVYTEISTARSARYSYSRCSFASPMT